MGLGTVTYTYQGCLVLITHLQLVFVLFVYSGQQLGFASVQGFDEGVALRHKTGLELHSVLLQDNRQRLEKITIQAEKNLESLKTEYWNFQWMRRPTKYIEYAAKSRFYGIYVCWRIACLNSVHPKMRRVLSSFIHFLQ